MPTAKKRTRTRLRNSHEHYHLDTALSTGSPLTIFRPSSLVTSWMSSSVSQQDVCMRVVAQQASVGRLRQEQLEQAVAMRAPRAPSPDKDQVQYLQDQLAHREAQLEHARSERDTLSAREKELLAHTRLLSSAAKDRKSRVANGAEQALVRESAEATRQTTEVLKTMDKQFQTPRREAEAQLTDTHESNSAQAQQLAPSLQQSDWSTSSCILQVRNACSWRHKLSQCHKTWNNKLCAWNARRKKRFRD